MPELDGVKYPYTPKGIKQYYKDKKKKKAGKPSAKDDYVDAKAQQWRDPEADRSAETEPNFTNTPESEPNPYYQTPTKNKVRVKAKEMGSPNTEMTEERAGKKYKFAKKLAPSPGRSLNGY